MALDRRTLIGTGLALSAASAGPASAAPAPFQHGVASGEPAATSVLLWTRLTGVGEASGLWRVARDPQMRDVAAQGEFTARAERDFTIKVELAGLQPGTDYWYQFEAAGAASPSPVSGLAALFLAGLRGVSLAAPSLFSIPRFGVLL